MTTTITEAELIEEYRALPADLKQQLVDHAKQLLEQQRAKGDS